MAREGRVVTDDEQRSQGGEGTMAPDVAGEGGRQPSPTALPPGPALVIAAHPDDAGMAALDATFPAAGNPRAFRDLLAEGLTAHKGQQVYLFYTANANAWVHISGEPLDRKVAALRHHVSQVGSAGEEDRWLRED